MRLKNLNDADKTIKTMKRLKERVEATGEKDCVSCSMLNKMEKKQEGRKRRRFTVAKVCTRVLAVGTEKGRILETLQREK